ncbi:uncharacterized protein METZ01_LOCUS384081 [marine metagenome]|uniref:Uncharacterized protein n=1 Tax=marine metagenome TaxID=408172 RepID=A0A382UB39_9ZZZZ
MLPSQRLTPAYYRSVNQFESYNQWRPLTTGTI